MALSAAPVTSHVSPGERPNRLERQRGPALVRDRDEHVGLGRAAEHDLERLRRRAARERGVERGAAAGEEDAGARREPAVADALRHLRAATRAARRWPSWSAVPARTADIPSRAVANLREDDARERGARRHGALPAGRIGVLLRDARRRLAVRDARVEGHRALRRAHVLQGHRAPADGPDDLDRDRRDRRRVQRVHGQGADRLLRPLRLGDTRRRARRAHRHAPLLPLRRGARSRRRRA